MNVDVDTVRNDTPVRAGTYHTIVHRWPSVTDETPNFSGRRAYSAMFNHTVVNSARETKLRVTFVDYAVLTIMVIDYHLTGILLSGEFGLLIARILLTSVVLKLDIHSY